jgi:DNA-binding response OmpR family regulator
VGNDLLIVDDDDGLLAALEAALSSRGWSVRTARDGRQALDEMRRALPTLVLADLEMPVMNGRQMIMAMADDPQLARVPVVVLSSFGYEWEAELMGAAGYVRKPATLDALDAELRRVLSRPMDAPLH